MKVLLLKNKKLLWVQEEKVQILAAIHAGLSIIAEEATLLLCAGVPDLDAPIITRATTSSSGEPGTSTGRVTPQGPRIIGAPALPPHWITPSSASQLPHSQGLGLSV